MSRQEQDRLQDLLVRDLLIRHGVKKMTEAEIDKRIDEIAEMIAVISKDVQKLRAEKEAEVERLTRRLLVLDAIKHETWG